MPVPGPHRALQGPGTAPGHYLAQFTDYERIAPPPNTFSLDRMRALLDALGHPESRWAAIHVAGTKGKGSTCALLASILRAAGVRVGLYTSPHLIALEERIQIDGRPVTASELSEALDALHPAIARVPSPPTYFEALTAAAFWLFAERAVDVAVLEVGLGGRLDATNVVDPLVSVVTPISWDHAEVLGPTVAAIAGEKAGIIKPGRPVVLAPQPPEALAVLRASAQEHRAPLVEVANSHWRVVDTTPDGQTIDLHTSRHRYPAIRLPLLGAHQAMNLATAVAALEQLPPERAVPEAAVARGAAEVVWPGRLQILERRPWVVVDGAQNAASAAALRTAVRALWPRQTIRLILGVSADKDLAGIAEALRPLSPAVIATQARHPRALAAGELAARLSRWFSTVGTAASVHEAVTQAARLAAPDDVILVTGSLFLIGELLAQAAAAHG
ncbi:MAG: bifunctional folylpolyglutamate synthase/dihydrofolate synthase [Candidatus Omnitrophica bacterium]|nr:bifunctional folylpolyglutamate synthase/dihydrofolate synthase [Candidatus Omnitrophota bacterium]